MQLEGAQRDKLVQLRETKDADDSSLCMLN
jgi:hypothetical protein